MGGSITFRPFRPEDQKNYLELYNYVYPVSMPGRYWRWRNRESPAGRSLIETAWDGGHLVGVYGVVPVRLLSGGKEVLAAFSDVAATHPDYRYRGIFSSLGKNLYRRAAESGIGAIYGFPTDHSRHGFISSLGWDYVRECRDLVRWGGGSPPGWAVEISSVDAPGEEFDLFWKRLSGALPVRAAMAVRDSKYLDWRFKGHPEKGFSIFLAREGGAPAGYLAVRWLAGEGEKQGEISDLLAVDVHTFRDLLGFALEYFSDAGCVGIRLPESGPFYHSARSMGFKDGGERYYFGCRGGCGRDWFYTIADSGGR